MLAEPASEIAVSRPQSSQGVRGWSGLRWDGCEVAILASGDSLTVEQCAAVWRWRDADPANRKAIAINTTFRRALWADVLYACDGPWWEGRDRSDSPMYIDEARATFAGALWTQDSATATKYGVNFIASERGEGLSRRPGVIFQGANGGHQAIGLTYWSGALTVYLLGFDMRGGHWHGEHPAMLRKTLRFDVFLKALDKMAADVATVPGFDVINCTPKSALHSFPKRAWQEVFA